MDKITQALRKHAEENPSHIALTDGHQSLTYNELTSRVLNLVEILAQRKGAIGLLADNGVDWAIADLAALSAGATIVPIAHFFSAAQIAHVIRTAGIGSILTDQLTRMQGLLGEHVMSTSPLVGELHELTLTKTGSAVALPAGTKKITFTSGTTGEPKGVCLGTQELETTAAALCEASAASSRDRHLCVLPLATLLENIGGIYAAILAGATICAPRSAEVGLSGSSGLDVDTLIRAIAHFRASSVILVPQILEAMIRRMTGGEPVPTSLRHIAVGGAPIAMHVLRGAMALGIPVYEGYGLSECASVVALNRPGVEKIGSVGKPLPHLRVRLADDGEIFVRGVTWRGYLGDSPSDATRDSIATGDLGHIDDDGFLFITGRKKNIFITSFGRNVAPEWVERELASRHPIAQAAVFGEARPFNCAVVVAHPSAIEHEIAATIADANRHLPDYARVGAWILASEPFTPKNGMSTFNGRLRRAAIFDAYVIQLNALYEFQNAG